MAHPNTQHLEPRSPKRTSSFSHDEKDNRPSSPIKRRCTYPLASRTTPKNKDTNNTTNLVQVRSSHLNITSILHLPEDAVWSLRKTDLQNVFLALQSYSLAHLPPTLFTPSPSFSTPPTPPLSTTAMLVPTPAFLRLPLEIRRQIYTACLPPSVSPPVRGPHPRQLQNPLHLTQPIPPSLLQLNQQIRSEALPLLYGAPSQTAHIVIDYNIWVHKTNRSDLVLSSLIPRSLRNLHVTVCLGSEKKPLTSSSSTFSSTSNHSPTTSTMPSSPGHINTASIEASARLLEVRKGVKKLGKWLAGADIKALIVSWQEPPNTYSWEQKKEVLAGLAGLKACEVRKGEINWGLEGRGKWNRGRRWRWEEGWEGEVERRTQAQE